MREINSQAEDEAGVPRKLGQGGSEGWKQLVASPQEKYKRMVRTAV